MRALLLALCLATVSACAPAYVEVGRSAPVMPGYVYTYPGGGCWADEIWYGSCPWYAGPTYGYYWYGSGRFNYRPGYSWGYRPHAPPPRTWHPNPRYRPPVVRDHRHR